MKTTLNICAIILIIIAGFFIYRHTVYYVGNGSLFSAKVASIAVGKSDPRICSKIKEAYINLGGPTEESTISECYYHFMVTNKNESLCSLVPTIPLTYSDYTSSDLCKKWSVLNSGRQYVTTNQIESVLSSSETQKVFFKDSKTTMSLPPEINGIKVEVKEIQTPVDTNYQFVSEGNIIRLEGETDIQKTANYRCLDKQEDNNQLPKVGDPFVINQSSRNKVINWGYSKTNRGFFSFTTNNIYCQLYDGGPFTLDMFKIDIQ